MDWYYLAGAVATGVWIWDWWSRRREPQPAPAPEPVPWFAQGESIHDFIIRQLSPQSRQLADSGVELPDAARREALGCLRQEAGLVDGALSYLGLPESGLWQTDAIVAALDRIAASGATQDLDWLHRALVLDCATPTIQAVAERVAAKRLPLSRNWLEMLRELARRSPDRGPVKLAIALLGLGHDPADAELIALLGRHDEFSVYAADALCKSDIFPQQMLFDMARAVTGWGRLPLLQKLAGTESAEIRDWLLREGHRCRLGLEHTALACASGGRLHLALAADRIDAGLLVIAGELLQALLEAGYAHGLDDYAEALAAVHGFLRHLELQRPPSLAQLNRVASLRVWLLQPERQLRNGGTEDLREECLAAVQACIAWPQWPPLIEAGLASDDDADFGVAAYAADLYGRDCRELHWQRLQRRPLDRKCWERVLACNSESEALLTAIALAEQVLPLAQIGSGSQPPQDCETGFEPHYLLELVLQVLPHLPGQGRALILAGMASPVVRGRHLALAALEQWDPGQIDKEIRHRLRQAKRDELHRPVARHLDAVFRHISPVP